MADDEAKIVRDFLGPVVLSTAINTFLYGLCVSFFVQYQRICNRDPLVNRVLVFWVLFVNTAHAAISTYMVWYYSVEHFNDVAVLESTPWPYVTIPVLAACVAGPCQLFFAWRVKELSGSWPMFYLLVTLTAAATGMSIAISACGILNPDARTIQERTYLLDIELALNSLCDALIAVFLLFSLAGRRTGFKKTDTLISRIINTCVQTSFFNSLVSLGTLIVFNATRRTNYCFLLAIPMGCIYSIALLAFLLSRPGIRDKLGGVTEIDIDDLTRAANRGNRRSIFRTADIMKHTEVRIAVEQQVEMDVDPFVRNTPSPVMMKRPISTEPDSERGKP
ncbi:hypothetical protein WOLCODRAFT_153966 [Wolfiporia cocos MD-104 SS10]|uniref:DUF6534 domain-containing protein n=1 Tax=Wolfiporia cocos (strain MD-104) TaxID=742152 RepID=A0A2H3JP00_WOLCO|nr:hypothetical protein WOLCODRAFT_153966 [Wolfiporia cocos MD-104 SS10]